MLIRRLGAVLLLAVLSLACTPALAQIAYNTPTDATWRGLDGATVSGKIHVQLGQTTGAPWTLCLGQHCNIESAPPFVLATETGNTDAANLYDTTTLTDGAYTVMAASPTLTSPLVATFTVHNAAAAPSPPTQPNGTQTGTGSVTVSWVAPDRKVDGSPLTDLAGFRIYYGQSQPLTTFLPVTDPTATSKVVTPLAAGTWYFAVTARTQSGAESDDSAVVSQVIADTPPPPPPPLPPDPCKVDPLTLSVKGWPGANIGSRSLSYSTDKPITGLTLSWPLKVTVTDSRGCTASVTR